MRKLVIVGVLMAVVVGVWVFYGRFAVEGGPAPWAIINDRIDVLEAALKGGIDAKQKEKAFSRAVQKRNQKAIQLLLAAGATPNPPTRGHCKLESAARYGDVTTVATLAEAGADPHLCGYESEIIADLLQYGFDRASQPELIRVTRLLVARGAPLDKDRSLKIARTRKLDEVAAFLENPSAAPKDEGASIKLARLGEGDKVDWDDLKPVCVGNGLAGLPAYQLRPGEVSPVVNLEQRGEVVFYRGGPDAILPRWWTASDDLRQTQVVACARVIEKKVAKECRYQGGGGGVTIYDATYELMVREARTAKILATKSVALPADSTRCDVVKFGTKQEGVYPNYSVELAALVRPIVGAP